MALVAEESVGLVLGKFCPFHNGHESMVRAALSECTLVLVMIYDAPDTTPISLSVRSQWVRDIFAADVNASGPRVLVLEAWMGPTVVGTSAEIQAGHEAYIIKLLQEHGFGPGCTHSKPTALRGDDATALVSSNGTELVAPAVSPAATTLRPITRFYSSEFYGEHVSAALTCIDRRVDPERGVVPTSGTACRADPYASRAFLHPLVYRSLVTNVAFVGAPSTGKSTLSERLAGEYKTVFMPEYGREYWEKHHVNRRLTLGQLEEIAEGHLIREDALLLQARDYLFVDTTAITTYMFSKAYHGAAEPGLVEYARAAEKRYDLVFLCGDDIPYADTWDRSGDTDRHKFQKQIRADLLQRRIPFVSLVGNLDTRIATVKRVLAVFSKWRSMGDIAFA